MKQSHREDTVGPWAEEKLKALEAYLRFYCTALNNKRLTLVYVDGFAGSPVTTIRQQARPAAGNGFLQDEEVMEHAEFVLGSPLRALQLELGFDKHYFFDLDERRVANLEKLQAEYPTKWMHVEVGDANERIRALVRRVQREPRVKGVAFLDPYGASLEWATVQALAETGKFEVITNLPIHMALNRLLMRDVERVPEWEEMVDRCFGTDEWRNIVYPKSKDLFGDETSKKAEGVPELLLDLYRTRLKELFSFTTNPRLIRNTKNSPLYYLLRAGHNATGKKGADYTLAYGEKLAKKNRL